MSTIQERLAVVFRQSLMLGADADVSGLEYGKHANWDSIAHMQLVAALENEFGLMLETDAVIGLSSFQKAVEFVKAQSAT